VRIRTHLRIEDDLNESLPVSEVHEDDATMIPTPVNPAHQRHFFTYFFFLYLTTIVRASEILEGIKL
jgi:hypothetical protein